MKRLGAIFLAAGLLLVSCRNDGGGLVASGCFAASVEARLPDIPIWDDTPTRASSQYTVRIKWAEGDRLSVLNLTTGKVLGGALVAASSGPSTTFSGQLDGLVREGDCIVYFYPAQDNATETDLTALHVDMREQSGTTGGVPLCVYSIARADAQSFDNALVPFSFLMSYVMIGLSDIPASASIRRVTIDSVTEAFDISANQDKNGLSITPYAGSISLTPGQTASAAGVKTVYAAIPASVAAERTLTLETSLTAFTTAFTGAALQNGYAYNTNVSGFLVDDLIPEDPLVREYCLAHFDANGDGRLTRVEIAGVSRFPEPLPAGIRRFNEVEFFYGLTEFPSFSNQKSLEAVTIPRQITAIPAGTFSGCSSLVKVWLLPQVPPTLGTNAFAGTPSGIILVADDAVVPDYQAADGWKNYYNNFRNSSSQNDSSLEIDTEDENTMGEERISIIVQG
jgi:hypothetical protein